MGSRMAHKLTHVNFLDEISVSEERRINKPFHLQQLVKKLFLDSRKHNAKDQKILFYRHLRCFVFITGRVQATTTNRTTHNILCLATLKCCPKPMEEPRVWLRYGPASARWQGSGTSSLLPRAHWQAPATPCKAGALGSFAMRWSEFSP